MKLLVLVGSTRQGSVNRKLAEAAVRDLPSEVTVTFFDRLADLPFYEEDAERAGSFPQVVEDFRAAVSATDALLMATPEYNGSMSALLKNAIDIASRPRGQAPLDGKPVAVIAASMAPRNAQWARESVLRTLTVAGAHPLEDTVGIGSAFEAFAEDGTLTDPSVQIELSELVNQLCDRVTA